MRKLSNANPIQPLKSSDPNLVEPVAASYSFV